MPAFRKAVGGSQISREHSLQAPVGGWNTRLSLAAMPSKYCVYTDNWYGEPSDVRVRRGHADHATGLPAAVDSLMPYNAEDGTQELYAASSDSFYDVSSAGAVGAAVVSSLSNARWNSFNFTISDGTSYLCCFNGVDSPRFYNGSSWTAITDVSTPAITGVTTTSIINGFVFKRRIFLILNNSLSLYYLPVDSVGGATQRTRLDAYFSKGGYIIAGGTWTIDGGDGMDDFLVVVSSEGQVAVFDGTNPSSATTWRLRGIWNVGEPIGRRCLVKMGGDLLLLTVQGLFPLSAALQSSLKDSSDTRTALTYNITPSMKDAAALYMTNYGWDIEVYPQDNQLIVNIPVSENAIHEQYVMNIETESWWHWTGIIANCWTVFNNQIYFGGDTTVGLFGGEVYDDNGEDINTDIKQAFSYLGARGRLKSVKAVRPNFITDGAPTALMGISVDYGDAQPQSTLSFSGTDPGQWDEGLWDAAVWGGEPAAVSEWQTVGAVGTAIAARLKTVTNGIQLKWAATDFLYEYGGVIG